MTQPFLISEQFDGEHASCIAKIDIDQTSYAVGTDKGVFIINIKDQKLTIINHMLQGKIVLTLKDIGDGNRIICGCSSNYFLVDYKEMTEKFLCPSKELIYNIHLLSQIDVNYRNLVITREDKSVNIVNILTGSLIKICDAPAPPAGRDNVMQLVTKRNKDTTFSFFDINRETKEVVKFTVKKQLLDYLLA